MALRVIVRTESADKAAHVGGSVDVDWRTFDIEAPEIEAYLAEKLPSLTYRQVVGIEPIALTADSSTPE